MSSLHLLRCLALVGASLLACAPVAAQPTEAEPTPIRAAVVDQDRNHVPDRVGDTLTVAGRVTMGSGQLHRNWTEVFIEDATGGLKLIGSSAAEPMEPGDSLIARGLLEHSAGMAQLTDPEVQIVPASPRHLTPRLVDLRTTRLEAIEGRLVELRGTVVEQGINEGGHYLLLLVDKFLVQVFVYTNRSEPFTLPAFEVGDYLRVRGIAGQFDRAPPYNGSYLLYPRTPDDVARAGLPPSYYRIGAAGIAALLLLALVWAVVLRRQVRRRVAELQATEARYSHLIESAGDAVFVHSAEGDASILETNDVAVKALGHSRPALRQTSFRALIAPEGQAAFDAHLASVERYAGALDVLLLRTRDGNVVPFETRTRRVDFGGEPVLLSIARDATARQAYERGLLEARHEAEHARTEAEEMARLKSALLTNMSHEIRTPLTAIIGFAEMLVEEVGPDQREYAEQIEHGGRRLLDTLNSVLDLARLDAGHECLHPAPLDVAAEVRSVAALIEPLATARGLVLHIEIEQDPCPATLDSSALGRVLHNLLGNAVKFTEQGGLRARLTATPEIISLHIADTGIGIDEAFLPALFTEFKQESEGHGRSHEGTGLGLAITKRLVELMGGTISVRSRKGVGSEFTVALPRHPLPTPGGDGALATGRVVG